MEICPIFELPEGNYVRFKCLDLMKITNLNDSYISWASRLHYLL
jgi:hypothetical protein